MTKHTSKTKAQSRNAKTVTKLQVRAGLLGRPDLAPRRELSAEQYAEVQRLAVKHADIVAAQRWADREAVAFGGKTINHYRVDGRHSPADMLRRALGGDPAGGEDALSDSIAAAADDLSVFVEWIADKSEPDDQITQRVGNGIENRLRVLAELARRMRDAVNTDAAANDGADTKETA